MQTLVRAANERTTKCHSEEVQKPPLQEERVGSHRKVRDTNEEYVNKYTRRIRKVAGARPATGGLVRGDLAMTIMLV
jgi:hypothetical protein